MTTHWYQVTNRGASSLAEPLSRDLFTNTGVQEDYYKGYTMIPLTTGRHKDGYRVILRQVI